MYRAMTKEGKEVVGWLVGLIDGFFIIDCPDLYALRQNSFMGKLKKVHPQSIAMGIGVLDKKGREIYSSIPISGEMSRGGDMVKNHRGDPTAKSAVIFKNGAFQTDWGQRWSYLEIIGRQGEQ